MAAISGPTIWVDSGVAADLADREDRVVPVAISRWLVVAADFEVAAAVPVVVAAVLADEAAAVPAGREGVAARGLLAIATATTPSLAIARAATPIASPDPCFTPSVTPI